MYSTLIIDGNNLAHRCRHVFHLSNKGVDVSVTYGMLHNISSLISRFQPESIIVCWDGGIPEFRRKAVPDYKANRDHGDPLEYDNFLRQVDELCDYALPLMGIVSVQRCGIEADDLLYHASRIFRGDHLIVTGDKDLFQAVNSVTDVYSPSKETVIDMANFEEVVGVKREDYIDWRALQGDSSDNIAGVPGIGEVTATKLFKEFGTLTNITNAASGHYPGPEKLSPKIATSIASFGFDRICKNIYITALYADRIGSRFALTQAVSQWHPANKDSVKKYLMRNAFVSLMDGLPFASTKLRPPRIMRDVRIPLVCETRNPVL